MELTKEEIDLLRSIRSLTPASRYYVFSNAKSAAFGEQAVRAQLSCTGGGSSGATARTLVVPERGQS
jgi:hypothetical protein